MDADPPSAAYAVDRTEQHIRDERWRGYDPYDALTSPLFRLPVLRSNRLIRFGAQQVVKRLPFNVRPLLGIEKGLNPVSVALFGQGLAHRAAADPDRVEDDREEATRCVAMLDSLATPGYSGACWGYPFDWEARHASIPAGTPTIVATGMVTNALTEIDRVFGIERAAELVRSAGAFVACDLHRVAGEDGAFCWSYSPGDRTAVLNATLKGTRLLAQAVTLGAPAEWLGAAAASARFVVAHQSGSGAWPYAIGDDRQWADNFHTGYVLECLHAYRECGGDEPVEEAMRRGWDYYRRQFFTPDMTPKYYDDRLGPVDATACAQAVITLCTFGDVEGAGRACARSIELLGRPDGSFAYQRRGTRVVRIPYLRWSTAWMYLAMARLEEARA